MLDIIEIEPGLWQGADPGKELPTYIKVAVDLRDDLPPQQYHDFMRGTLWVPVIDGIFPGTHWLDGIVEYILANKRAGNEVLVHCAQGISRSALVCAAVLMKEHNISSVAAMEELRLKHPAINPAPRYQEALRQYDTFLAEQSWNAL